MFKKSRWFNPYTKTATGKLVPTIKDCWTCAQAGVYFIRSNRTGAIVYVGSSTTQLKKTIYRHFQQWTDKQKSNNRSFERVTYAKTGYQIRFFKCTAEQALRMEKYLINKLEPRDNPLKYQLIKSQMEAGERLYKHALNSETIIKSDYVTEDTEVPF